MNIDAIMFIILICDCIIHAIGFSILGLIEIFSDFDTGDFLSHPFPKNIHNQTNLNWFGTIFVWVLAFIFMHIYFIIYMFYWLIKGVCKSFTMGRK